MPSLTAWHNIQIFVNKTVQLLPGHLENLWCGMLPVLTPLLSLTGVLLFTVLAGLQPKLRTSRE